MNSLSRVLTVSDHGSDLESLSLRNFFWTTIEIDPQILLVCNFVCQAQFASWRDHFERRAEQWQEEDQRVRSA